MNHNLLKSYLESLFGYAGRSLVLAFFLMLLVGLTEGVSLVMLIPLLGFVGISETTENNGSITEGFQWIIESAGLSFSLATVLLLFVSFVCMQAFLRRSANILVEKVSLNYVDFLRQRIFKVISSTNWLFFIKKRSSDFNHVLTSDLSRVYQGTFYILRLGIVLVMSVVYLAVSFHLSAAVTIFTMLIGILLLAFLYPMHKKSRRLGESLTTNTRELYNLISEHLQGMKLAKIYGREQKQMDNFNYQTNELREQQLEFQHSYSNSHMWFSIGAVLFLSALVFLAHQVVKVPTAELLVLIFIFARLMPLISLGQQCYQQTVHMLPAFSSANKMYQSCLSAQEKNSIIEKSETKLPELQNSIQLSHVYFQYDKQSSVLIDVNLTISARSTTAIIGPSGSGKSTLADLLMSLITADQGRLFVDGVPLTNELQHSWRQQIAYVSQDTFLFHKSIRDNLLWADPEANESRLWSILSQAAADKFVRDLPEGIDTVVGERGNRLSGGERQRIAIACALMRKPSLLILDEATSSLDTNNEKQIQQTIDRLHGELTIVVIAHQISTVRQADHIIVLDEGKIIESGSWDELASKKNGYLTLKVQSTEHQDIQVNNTVLESSNMHSITRSRTRN